MTINSDFLGSVGQERFDPIAGTDEEEAEMEQDVEVANDNEEEVEGGNVKVKKKPKKSKEASRSMSFDSSLPSSHTYLGTDLEEISGRTILEDDSVIELPLVTLPGTILVPGHIIPLYSHNQHEVAMLKSVVDSTDKTFGVVALRMDEEYRHIIAGIGTTAEIYSVKNEMDDASGISTITVLAQGRQRFELKEYRRTITGRVNVKVLAFINARIIMGTVKVLPDTELGEVFQGVQPHIHCKLCCLEDHEEDFKVAMDRQGRIISCVKMTPKSKINRFSAANYTWWPPWVYKMYDTELLMKRVKTELQKWDDTLSSDKLPKDATKLSYWVTQNIPLDDSLKLHLLSINNAVQRLRCALHIICKCSILCCKDCNEQIADMSNVFSMSVSGPLSAYVNPGGHVHETVTVHQAENLNLIGRPSTDHSWFPGYAWTIAQCKRCSAHMGWKFTTRRKDLIPHKFWGLCRSSLIPGMSDPDHKDKGDWTPVM
ncbi:protein cereblon-like isoform X2 [Mercenaria mercenaria]|uniref:protein cereblon-like isoform X2 n=1 Tax=Mercenaria mercenaria TaxID=6596 RepID=UPI00234E4EBC|nr:protein cereblon-like isoform X2 [Mercenaria mercenaria]